MAELQGQVGELRMKLQITRAATGQVEEVELIGFVEEDKLQEFLNDSNPQHSGAQCSN